MSAMADLETFSPPESGASKGTKGKKAPKTLKVPSLPKIKLPKIPRAAVPSVDVGVLLGGVAIAGLSAAASIVAVHVFLPAREIRVVRNPTAVLVGREFNRTGVPGFTVGPDVADDFVANTAEPQIDQSAYIHPQADVLGDVQIGAQVLVAPHASIRGDVGQDIRIEDSSAVLDGAVITGRPTEERGIALGSNQVQVRGKRYSVYLGKRVTIGAQAQVRGPAIVDDDTYVGSQALVDHAMIGKGCVLEPRSAVIGVIVGDGRYVPAGDVVHDQTAADILPLVTGTYAYHDADAHAVQVDTELADAYNALYPRPRPTQTH